MAEAFLVAWRRIEDAPQSPGDFRAWLFGIARGCLRNARRSEGRGEALAVRLAEATHPAGAADCFDPEPPVALAERRGNFVAVLFHDNNPDLSGSCVAWNRPGSNQVDHVDTAIGGSSGPAWTPAAGRISQGMIADYGGDPPASFSEGAVGRRVVGVTIHADRRTITATVKNGRYAAWWPGQAFSDGPTEPSGQGGPAPILTYDVRLSDGTVKKNVAPALPR